MNYETVIGLEVHAQLRTETKLFCSCKNVFGAAPNTQVCERCLGMPGVLPVLNRKAVEFALRAALALECDVHLTSQWSRKNYFYPDLPKGYQISQFDRPYATGGGVAIHVEGEQPRRIDLTRIHMEEDAGKNVHDASVAGGRSFVDFNRGGTPLIEIVSEPQIHTAKEASAYLKVLRQILRHIGACDGNMEEGSLRCDANVSIRPVGVSKLGTRTELKNINSFRFIEQAIEYEVLRQSQILDAGETVLQETRLWDTRAKKTRSMRSKEDAHDYRYFPDPDLPNLVIDQAFVDQVRKDQPELPCAMSERYVRDFGLSAYDAGVLVDDPAVAAFFEATIALHNNPKGIANWVINTLPRELIGQGLDVLPLGPQELAELIQLIDTKVISGKIAKEVFGVLIESGGSPRGIVKDRGLEQLTDSSSIEPIIDQLIAEHPNHVAQYRAGKEKLLGFFVGKVMKATSGKASPSLVNDILKKRLGTDH